MKHIRDLGTITITSILGEPINDDGMTAEEHARFVAKLELNGVPEKLVRSQRTWTARTFSFANFCRTRLLADRFSKDMTGQLMASDIQHAIREMGKTGWLSLVDEHYEALKAAAEKPDESCKYNNAVAHNFTSFALNVVRGALDELPPEEVRAGPPAPNGAEAAVA